MLSGNRFINRSPSIYLFVKSYCYVKVQVGQICKTDLHFYMLTTFSKSLVEGLNSHNSIVILHGEIIKSINIELNVAKFGFQPLKLAPNVQFSRNFVSATCFEKSLLKNLILWCNFVFKRRNNISHRPIKFFLIHKKKVFCCFVFEI